MNLWHDVPQGDKAPEEVNVLIEIPKGSHNKYELDKETSLIKLDRANYNGAPYPCEYGFIPQTLGEDGDALDILLLATYPLVPGALATMRPVALMEMTDDGEPDNKVIGVPVDDRRWDDVNDLGDLNKHTLKEFQNFFETIKQLKAKPAVVTVHGFKSREAALEEIKKGSERYKQKFAQ